MNERPRIAVVTYNEFYMYENGIHCIETIPVLIAGRTFYAKNPSHVVSENEAFRSIYQYKDTLEYIVIFIGKKTSGSLEIIDLFCTFFNPQRCIFVSCHHDTLEKDKRLGLYYGTDAIAVHCRAFIDPRVIENPMQRCDESGPLIEAMYECIKKSQKKNN